MKTDAIKLPAALLSGVILGAVMFTAVSVSAHDNGDRPTKEEWSAMSDEERQTFKEERKAEREARRAERLQEKLDDGTITQEQKTQIEEWIDSKQQEREADREDRPTREEIKAMSDEERQAFKEERKAEREAKKAEAQEFFESIGLDPETLFDGDGHGHKRGPGGGMKHR